jgi:ribosomal protein S6
MTEEATQQDQYTDETSRLYELGFHLIPSIADDKLEQETSALRQLIEQYAGEITEEHAPTHMQLAYAMEHRTQHGRATYETAYFGWIKFEMQPERVEEMQEELRENTSILRFIVVKTVPGAGSTNEDEAREAEAEEDEQSAEAPAPEATTAAPADTQSAGEGSAVSSTEEAVKTDEQLDKHIDELVGDETNQTEESSAASAQQETTAAASDDANRNS